MADLDDGPDQTPLAEETVKAAILNILPAGSFELLLSHAPDGEYSRHRRHEEVSRAVAALWSDGNIPASRMGMFAYQDSQGKILPTAIQQAHCLYELPPEVFSEKYRLITQVYGFDPSSWEARSVPHQEAFWCFSTPQEFNAWHGNEAA